MEKAERREAYLWYIEDYCNNLFDKENLPGGIKLALNRLEEIDPLRLGVASETVGDLSITYSTESNEAIPNNIKIMLAPYVRPHLVGDKKKRGYIDGRD